MTTGKLKRLTALLLSLIMVGSMLTDVVPLALAAGTPAPALTAAADTTDQGDRLKFDSTDNGRPNLYVDFLGDNWYYSPVVADRPTVLPLYGAAPTDLRAPASYDQSAESNPDYIDPDDAANNVITNNVWHGYDHRNYTGSLFWVGVGVDRTQVLELLKGGKGLTSLELAFYYNDTYLEPYVDASGDFAATITAANINNAAYPDNTQWSDYYTILRAEERIDLANAQHDPVTQETVTNPSYAQILANDTAMVGGAGDADWKMTYLSLELKDPVGALTRRLDSSSAKGYDEDYFLTDADGAPDPKAGRAPASASGTEGPEYLMLIPFRLKGYDEFKKLCLRLVRDATHFSIGGGADGTEPYGAWERVTTRNPGSELKLMTRFTGDLNIFSGKKEADSSSEALLRIVNGGSARNRAKLSVDGDPAVYPVYADANNEIITGLKGGLGMVVETQVYTGYQVSVAVYQGNVIPDPSQINNPIQVISHTVVKDQEKYTFVMPDESIPENQSVIVVVIFEPLNRDNYTVYLSEIFDGARKTGNDTIVRDGTGKEVVSSNSPVGEHPLHPAAGIEHADGPIGEAPKNKSVTISVSTHEDYWAKVRIFNFADETWIDSFGPGAITGGGADVNGLITLEHGGTVTFDMPQAEVDIEVTYEPAETHKVQLLVGHVPDVEINADNTAQLAYVSYDSWNMPGLAYSGQVYNRYVPAVMDDTVDPPVELVAAINEEDRVKNDPDGPIDAGKVITWVPMSAASLSKSLGGDTGRTGRAWVTVNDPVTGKRAIMSQLYSADTKADLAAALDGLDFSAARVTTTLTGLRKDMHGNFYGDDAAGEDMTAVADLLWELRTLILADTSTGGYRDTYVKSVSETVEGVTTVAYTYFDLTAAQVQAYAMEMEEAGLIQAGAMEVYRELYRYYLEVQQTHTQVVANEITKSATAPEAPKPPRGFVVDAGTGVRSYEGNDYATKYYNGYMEYLNGDGGSNVGYRAYIADLAAGAPSGVSAFTYHPDDRPDLVEMEILSRTDAVAKVNAASWGANIVNNQKNYIETREGRTVYVALEANSAYEVDSVLLYNVDNGQLSGLLTTTTVEQPDGFVNVYSFTMPDQDCAVRVLYKKRGTVTMTWSVVGAAGNNNNLATVLAYQVDPTATVPLRVEKSNAGHQSVATYVGDPFTDVPWTSIVTVTVKHADGFTPSVSAVNTTTGGTITIDPPVPAENPADGDVYTFPIPSNCAGVRLTITFKPDAVATHTATIQGQNFIVTENDPRNDPTWDDGSTVKSNVPVGQLLEGAISVAPGYYIYAVTATGASGDYAYTLGGNGYNNGKGTYNTAPDGTVTNDPIWLSVVMPDEDLLVTVVFRKGVPPVEPTNALTLKVVDPGNTGTTKDDNFAKATAAHVEPDGSVTYTTIGPVGLGTTGGNKLAASGYVPAGDEVIVDYSCVVNYKDGKVDQATSYYVSSITVGPSDLGVQLEWLPGNKVKFVMPAGSAGVTVTFEKGEAPSWFIDATRLENGSMTLTELNNRYRTIASDTIKSFLSTTREYTLVQSESVDPGTGIPVTVAINPETVPRSASSGGSGAAKVGETVTVTFQAAAGWYVQMLQVSWAGATWNVPFTVTSGTNDGVGASVFTADFTMPTGNVEIIVHYRKGPRPVTPEYALKLVVKDDENVEDAALSRVVEDNWVQATATSGTRLVPGTATPATLVSNKVGKCQTGMWDVIYPQAGDTITLDYTLQPGFILDYMVVTPAGLRISPSYVSVGTRTVTVPDPSGGGGTVTRTITEGRATFVMPTDNVTVIANIVRGTDPKRYTANLILRLPAGLDPSITIDEVGQGTFLSPTAGSLDLYSYLAVYSTAQAAGTPIDIGLYAFDGYYIRAITIDPPVGATATLSGAFGYQNGRFIMPAANVNVNVWFEKGWPDEVQYDLTLKVIDPTFVAADYAADTPANQAANYNYASFRSAGSTVFAGADADHVFGSQSKTLSAAAFDRDRVYVDVHTRSGFHVSDKSILVTDNSGASVPWRYEPGGLSFTMPPSSTTVTITFLKNGDPGDPTDPNPKPTTYEVVLHAATLDAGAGDSVSLTDGTTTKTAHGDVITGLTAGTTLTVTATPGTDRQVKAAYAIRRDTGEQIMLPITLVRAGGTSGFAMPNANADVFVVYGPKEDTTTPDPGDPDPGPRDQVVNLVVSGERGAVPPSTVNRAIMVRNGNTATGKVEVTASGADSLFASINDNMVVTMEVASGYYISVLSVTGGSGGAVAYSWISMVENDAFEPSVWEPNPARQITFPVPAGGATVYVRYEKIPTPPGPVDPAGPYTAQVVVNDEAYSSTTIPSRNDAGFPVERQAKDPVTGDPLFDGATPIMETVLEKLRKAHAGDWIDLSVVVHEGYKIAYIKVVPQEFGIVPTLPLTPMDSQSTGFTMPAGNVTVYVKFVPDGLTRYNATLVAAGGPDVPENNAQITSGFSGTKGPITPNDTPVSVRAAAGREKVTVEYWWQEGTPELDPSDPGYIQPNSVASVTVRDLRGNDVPFTQVDPHTIVFPMVAKDVVVTVTYRPDPEPVGYPVVLHVIDKDAAPAIDLQNDGTDDWNYGRLIYDPDLAKNGGSANLALADTGKVDPKPTPGHVAAPIYVPAGKLVDLIAASDVAGLDGYGKVYIESAYVLYEQGGQMLRCDLPPDADDLHFSGYKTSDFAVHPGRNDVYVSFTRDEPKEPDEPQVKEYSAVVMIKGAAADTTSHASICVGTNYVTADRRDNVVINSTTKTHGYVTASRKETITVSAYPAAGYAVDYILMTPLGDPTNPTPVRVDNTYTFSMPGHNVAITIFLKEDNDAKYDVTLHFAQIGATPTTDGTSGGAYRANRGEISWTSGSGVTDIKRAYADPGEDVVTLVDVAEGATVTLSTTLDSPYTVLAAYALRGTVLVPLAPGLEGVTEGASAGNNTLSDAAATFTVSGGDVDVYLVVTDTPPVRPDWHTAVLVVTDKKGDDENVGHNGAYLEDDEVPPNQRLAETGIPGAPKMGHEYLTVWEGQTVTTTVQPPQPGYRFRRRATISHSVGGVSTVDESATGLHEISISPFIYTYVVGDYNSAVAVHFEGEAAKTNPLTVIIEDPDNPGSLTGGVPTVTNAAEVTPNGMTTLELKSVNSAGAIQVIPNVAEGKRVDILAIPQVVNKGLPGQYTYFAYATYKDDNTTTTAITPFTYSAGLGGYTGSITMPSVPATVTIHFYVAYTGTLTIVDRNLADPTSEARMNESFRGGEVSVDNVQRSASLAGLPHLTELAAHLTRLQPTSRLTAVLASSAGSSWLLSPTLANGDPMTAAVPETEQYYRHTIDRADGEIIFILDNAETAADDHVAAVRTVGKPAAAPAPGIKNDTAAGAAAGRIWTTANKDDEVVVNARVPEHYKVVVTAVTAGGTKVTLTAGTDCVLTDPYTAGLTYNAAADSTVKFKMPDDNVQVTVTYVKVEFTLTLAIRDTSGAANVTKVTPAADLVVPGNPAALTNDGDQTLVKLEGAASQTVTVSADLDEDATTAPPTMKARLVGILVETASGGSRWIKGASTADVLGVTFNMPADDTTVTVIYAPPEKAPSPTEPDPDLWYIASVTTVGGESEPGNAVQAIQNRTSTDLPSGSPVWAAGRVGDEIRVSFTTAPGWWASVAAKRTDNSGGVTVVQQGLSGAATATIRMPSPGTNVEITVTFHRYDDPTEPDPPTDLKMTLRLVGHGEEADNKGNLTGGSWSDLMLDGTKATLAAGIATPSATDPYLDQPGVAASPVRLTRKSTDVGDLLVISADWASGYLIDRITVSVPVDPAVPNGPMTEADVPVNYYGTNARARVYTPGEGAMVTVYYTRIYTATLHIVGASGLDKTSMTDDRAVTVTSTGSDPINKTGDKLIELRGGARTPADPGEKIQTTAIPDLTANKRLVGVVYESDLTGAGATTRKGTTDEYDFHMPTADVDVYAVYEEEPADPKDRSYIAKAAVDPDSVDFGLTVGGRQNMLSIRNETDAAAAAGKYWTAAKAKDTVTITVELAPGYQALVTSAIIDDPAQQLDAAGSPIPAGSRFHYYVTRTSFVVSGKTTTFSMPANSDATVTIKFIKGYDLTLIMTDETIHGDNLVETAVTEPAAGPGDPPVAVLVAASDAAKNVTAENSVADAPAEGTLKLEVELDTTYLVENTVVKAYPALQPERNVTVRVTGGAAVGNNGVLEKLSAGTTMVLDLTIPEAPPGLAPTGQKSVYKATCTLDGTPITAGADGKYVFAMPAADAKVEVSFSIQFVPIEYTARLNIAPTSLPAGCSVVLSAVGGGSASNEGDVITGLRYGQSMSLLITLPTSGTKYTATYSCIQSGLSGTTDSPKSESFAMPASNVTVVVTVNAAGTWSVTPGAETAMAPVDDGAASLFAVTLPNSSTTTVEGLESDLEVSSDVSRKEAETTAWVTRYTPFTGTRLLYAGADGDYFYPMPGEDTIQNVLFRNSNDPDDLLAKVQLRGESDINGNRAEPIHDKTETEKPAGDVTKIVTREGVVWTTTREDNTIDLAISVARNYMAKVKVLRDDSAVDLTGTLAVELPESDWVFLDMEDYDFQVDGKSHKDAGSLMVKITDTEFSIPFTPGADPVLGNGISDLRHFTFTMPEDRATVPAVPDDPGTPTVDESKPEEPGDKKTDVTVIVEFVYVGDVPAPYDPYHTLYDATDNPQGKGMPAATVAKLTEGFIYGENRRGYAVLDIPTLFKDEQLYHTDEYNPGDASTQVVFHFYLYDAATDVYTELELDKDIVTLPYDEDDLRDPADLYNYIEGMYTLNADTADTSDDLPYVGSRFILQPKVEAGATTANGDKLKAMLNNLGSLYDASGKPYDLTTKLFVTAVNQSGEESSYTEVWLRPSYSLELKAISYGPGHPITGHLYRLMTPEEYDAAQGNAPGTTAAVPRDDMANYFPIPAYTDYVEPIDGESKWQQTVRICTSELLGDYLTAGAAGTVPVYALTLEKVSNITYTRVDLPLDTGDALHYSNVAGERTFTIHDTVTLIAGDVNGDNNTKWQDYEFLRKYVERSKPWSNTDDPTDADWEISTLNPKSVAYRCDLNSDGVISIADLNILTTVANYNKTVESYKWWDGTASAWVLPHGLEPDPNPIALAMGMTLVSPDGAEAFPVPFDPIWDAQVVPEELLAEEETATPAPAEPPVVVPVTPGKGETPLLPVGDEVTLPDPDRPEPPALPQPPKPDPVELPRDPEEDGGEETP